MPELQPFFETVQSIYDHDHSLRWLQLFLDPKLVYSCAYFEREEMTLAEAQQAKLDLALGKCDLRRGQTLLEIGCGYGACSFRAAERYGVNVIALTLSEGQQAYCRELMKTLPAGAGRVDVRLQGWEEFHEPVDRIISIGAFEHFGHDRHDTFFSRCRELLPSDGRLLLHTIVAHDFNDLRRMGLEVTSDFVQFVKFLYREIFPGGSLRRPERLVEFAQHHGFLVSRVHSLQQHYARTLATWAANLEAQKDTALRLRSPEDYDRHMKYLTGCAHYFRSGYIDVCQFTCEASGERARPDSSNGVSYG
jgi:cyclopropane-fatty-acyl-phospholipid synthase